MKTVIVPGVGGSEAAHWQSWLQQQLPNTIRVEQDNWNHPVLSIWVARFKQVIEHINEPVQIVAHSFGCLTSVAALAQFPALAQHVQVLVLVAPANPERFSESGVRKFGESGLITVLPQQALTIPTRLIASRNDPWLGFAQAQQLAQQWQAQFIDLGHAGHINVTSGFGAWPEILQHIETTRLLGLADTEFMLPLPTRMNATLNSVQSAS